MKNYENFVKYLTNFLVDSNEHGVQAAARGILWKLENEAILKKELLIKNENDISDDQL